MKRAMRPQRSKSDEHILRSLFLTSGLAASKESGRLTYPLPSSTFTYFVRGAGEPKTLTIWLDTSFVQGGGEKSTSEAREIWVRTAGALIPRRHVESVLARLKDLDGLSASRLLSTSSFVESVKELFLSPWNPKLRIVADPDEQGKVQQFLLIPTSLEAAEAIRRLSELDAVLSPSDAVVDVEPT